MKILEIVYGLSSGGAERLVVDLCNEMSKENEVHLLVLKDVEQFYANQLFEAVHVHYALFPVGFSIKQQWKTYLFIKKLRPDVVHVHSQARYSLLLTQMLLHNGTKYYMTIHSDVERSYHKGLSGLQVRLAKAFSDTRFITISKENHRQFKEYYPKYKVRMIVNGRSMPKKTAMFYEVQKEIDSFKNSPNTTVFIHIARCVPIKNQKLLITAFNRFVQDGADAILLIIGSLFDSSLGKTLQELAGKNVFFLGPRYDVYDYLAYADAFCLSSLQEGMPMTIIEAILSGIPIISTPVCGAIDAVENGKNGLLTVDFSVERYCSALEEFETNKQSLKSYALSHKDDTEYSIACCAKRYLDWFRE